MCGRDYSTYTEEELYFRYINEKSWPWSFDKKVPQFSKNYNMCPTQTGIILSVVDSKLTFRNMRWGLVPAWAKAVKDADKYSMINARSEEITEKKSFKAPFLKRRCIIPISGFYEWKRLEDTKIPFAISLSEEPIMSMAGIWECWEDKESKEQVLSFAVITKSSNTFMSQIHDRMPVILSKEEEAAWLDPMNSDLAILQTIIKATDKVELKAKEVSKLVNSPKNNSPEILNGK